MLSPETTIVVYSCIRNILGTTAMASAARTGAINNALHRSRNVYGASERSQHSFVFFVRDGTQNTCWKHDAVSECGISIGLSLSTEKGQSHGLLLGMIGIVQKGMYCLPQDDMIRVYIRMCLYVCIYLYIYIYIYVYLYIHRCRSRMVGVRRRLI